MTPLGVGADGPPQWRPRQSHLAQRPGREKEKHADTAVPHTQNNTKHAGVSLSLSHSLTHSLTHSPTHSLTRARHTQCTAQVHARHELLFARGRSTVLLRSGVQGQRGVLSFLRSLRPYEVLAVDGIIRLEDDHSAWLCSGLGGFQNASFCGTLHNHTDVVRPHLFWCQRYGGEDRQWPRDSCGPRRLEGPPGNRGNNLQASSSQVSVVNTIFWCSRQNSGDGGEHWRWSVLRAPQCSVERG